jgi:hypothetical protein
MTIPNFAPLFRPSVHQWLFFTGLALTAASMPNSVWVMSVSQFILAGNWLLEGRYRDKILRFWNNKAAVAFTMIYVLHLLSLLWSQYPGTEMSNLRIKVPLLTFTFIIASSAPSFDMLKTKLILLIFATSVLVTTFIGYVLFLNGDHSNFRDLSPFISHIRFGLMIVLSIFLFPWLILQPGTWKKGMYGKILIICSGMAVLWLIYFLTMMQTLSAIASLAGVVLYLSFYFLLRAPNKLPALVFGMFVLLVAVAGTFYMLKLHRMVSQEFPTDVAALPTHTIHGTPYAHFPEIEQRENGHLVYILVADPELKQSWQQASALDYEGTDEAGQLIRYTLYRYLTSLGLSKDEEGFSQLTPEDIRAVEQGLGNHLYREWPGLVIRLHQSLWEIDRFRKGNIPEGHSLGQRLEYWDAAWIAIQQKPILGWGLGDVYLAMDYGFTQSQSQLSYVHRQKPHNQYLTFLIYFGWVGLIVIAGIMVFVIRKTKSWHILPNQIFMIIMAVSMISEDTIESQAGLTFFVFFVLFFNFIYVKHWKTKDKNPDWLNTTKLL